MFLFSIFTSRIFDSKSDAVAYCLKVSFLTHQDPIWVPVLLLAAHFKDIPLCLSSSLCICLSNESKSLKKEKEDTTTEYILKSK